MFDAPHYLDGSDGPAQQPKTQAQYSEKVKAHLAAAHTALRRLTVESVEVLCSDPTLNPLYVGCMRELAGLGHGSGGKEGVPRKAIPEKVVEKARRPRSYPLHSKRVPPRQA